MVTRRHGAYAAYLALFGRSVRLPYVSPFRVIDLRGDDPLVRRWRWELDHVDTVDDFVLWIDAGTAQGGRRAAPPAPGGGRGRRLTPP